MREDQLAWIMGSSRSGSSWLLRMLRELDRVVGIDDPHVGHHLGVWRPVALAWAAATERPALNDLRELKRDKPDYFFSDRYRDAWMPALRELILARFGAQLAAEHPAGDLESRLVVKEPGSHAADLLFEAFPDSRLIFLLRDGRDVVDSWLDAYRRGSWAIEEGAFPVAREGRLALIEWLSSVWSYRSRVVADAYAERPPDRRVLVRYENLLADPARELGRIAAMLGLDVGPAICERIASRHDYNEVSPRLRGAGQEIRSASPGGWRRNLSRAEQRAMHEIMGAELRALGYLDAAGRAAA
ncbi:MAG: sulfotransferase family protein [Solirubrobacterales bacterium]